MGKGSLVFDPITHTCSVHLTPSLGKVFGVVKFHKVAFFVWTTVLNSILSIDNLVKQKLVVVNICVMYNGSSKTIEHLLLHHTIARKPWSFSFAACGVLWVMPGQVLILVTFWRGVFGSHHNRVV